MKKSLSVLLLIPALTILLAGDFPTEYTNLQVFPKDISPDLLKFTMQSFTEATGEKCSFCHAQNEAGAFDFASDANSHKGKARVMLNMVGTINSEFLPKVAHEPGHSPEVTCMTCHRGKKEPEF